MKYEVSRYADTSTNIYVPDGEWPDRMVFRVYQSKGDDVVCFSFYPETSAISASCQCKGDAFKYVLDNIVAFMGGATYWPEDDEDSEV